MAYTQIFLLKKCEKLLHDDTHIFFNKSTGDLDIVLTRTIKNLTTNELVKLTML